MQKLKKSKTRPRTQRSIEMEEARREIIEREQQKEELKKQNNKRLLRSFFCIYSAAMSIMSWLFDWMGVIALTALVLGIFGYRSLPEKKGRDYYAVMAGLILSSLRLAVVLFTLIRAV